MKKLGSLPIRFKDRKVRAILLLNIDFPNSIFLVLGVATATVTEISFDLVGLGSALVATAGFFYIFSS